jgi:hypothetical protein
LDESMGLVLVAPFPSCAMEAKKPLDRSNLDVIADFGNGKCWGSFSDGSISYLWRWRWKRGNAWEVEKFGVGKFVLGNGF